MLKTAELLVAQRAQHKADSTSPLHPTLFALDPPPGDAPATVTFSHDTYPAPPSPAQTPAFSRSFPNTPLATLHKQPLADSAALRAPAPSRAVSSADLQLGDIVLDAGGADMKLQSMPVPLPSAPTSQRLGEARRFEYLDLADLTSPSVATTSQLSPDGLHKRDDASQFALGPPSRHKRTSSAATETSRNRLSLEVSQEVIVYVLPVSCRVYVRVIDNMNLLTTA